MSLHLEIPRRAWQSEVSQGAQRDLAADVLQKLSNINGSARAVDGPNTVPPTRRNMTSVGAKRTFSYVGVV